MYCTQADLIKALGRERLTALTDDSGSGAIGTSVVEDVVSRASGVIDDYLSRGGYAVPVVPVPESLRNHAINLSKAYLYERRLQPPPEDVLFYYRETMEDLTGIGKGTRPLALPKVAAESAPGGMRFTVVKGSPLGNSTPHDRRRRELLT